MHKQLAVQIGSIVADAIAQRIFPGAVVLIACAVIPALFAMKSLVFTFFLLVAGGLCLARKSPAAATQPRPAFATV